MTEKIKQLIINLNKSPNWIILVIVILCLLCRVIPGTRTVDDAYITFRYVRNIIEGEGFVYNPGERVLGTTTPLYTLLLTVFSYVFIHNHLNELPLLALLINTLADIASCLILYQIGKKVGSVRVGMITAALWAIAPFSVTFAIGGLETSVYVFWLLLTAYHYMNNRYIYGALGAAMSVLTRPDALILLLPIGVIRLVHIFIKNEGINWKEIIIFLVPTGVWMIFSTIYFGSPIPHSVQAKLLTYRLGPTEGLIRLLQHYATPFMDNNLGGKYAIMVGIFLYPFLFLLGSVRGVKKTPLSIILFLYPLLYLVVYSIANPLIFRWYLTPPLPLYFLGIVLGIDKIICDVSKALSGKRWIQYVLLIALLSYPFVGLFSEWTLSPDHGSGFPAPEMSFVRLELLYKEMADRLVKTNGYTKYCNIAAGDVGVLGFFTGARILDTVGLNSLQSLQYYPIPKDDYVINYAIPDNLILSELPDFFIFLEVYGRNTVLVNQEFLNQYELVYTISTDMYGSKGMLLYKNKQMDCSTDESLNY